MILFFDTMSNNSIKVINTKLYRYKILNKPENGINYANTRAAYSWASSGLLIKIIIKEKDKQSCELQL